MYISNIYQWSCTILQETAETVSVNHLIPQSWGTFFSWGDAPRPPAPIISGHLFSLSINNCSNNPSYSTPFMSILLYKYSVICEMAFISAKLPWQERATLLDLHCAWKQYVRIICNLSKQFEKTSRPSKTWRKATVWSYIVVPLF